MAAVICAWDVGAEVDLAVRLLHGLAHLARDDLGEFLAALAVQLGGAAHEGGALRDGAGLRPGAVRTIEALQGSLDAVLGDEREFLSLLASRWVHNYVGAQTHSRHWMRARNIARLGEA